MLINKINPKNVRRTKNYDKRRNQESLQNHHFILCVRKRDSRLVILEDLIFTEQEINSQRYVVTNDNSYKFLHAPHCFIHIMTRELEHKLNVPRESEDLLSKFIKDFMMSKGISGNIPKGYLEPLIDDISDFLSTPSNLLSIPYYGPSLYVYAISKL